MRTRMGFRGMKKSNDSGFFSMKENPSGMSVGNFVSNVKNAKKAVEKLFDTPAIPGRRVRRGVPIRRFKKRTIYGDKTA